MIERSGRGGQMVDRCYKIYVRFLSFQNQMVDKIDVQFRALRQPYPTSTLTLSQTFLNNNPNQNLYLNLILNSTQT